MNTKLFLSRIFAFACLLVVSLAFSSQFAAAQSGMFVVEPTSGLITDEDGGQAYFSVYLSNRPKSAVQVDLASSNPAEGSVSPQKLVLNPGNWSKPATVTITGLPDEVADGDQTYTILLGPARSNDSLYDGQDPPDVSVTNLDVQDAQNPQANDDSDITVKGVAVTTNVLANDKDLGEKPFTLTIARQPEDGSAEASGESGITYTPDPAFTGQDSYDYKVCNPAGRCGQASVTILVEAENSPPQAVDDEYSIAVNTAATLDVMSNDSDADGDTLYLESFDFFTDQGGVVTRIDNGTFSDTSDDQLFYLPPINFDGSDTFNYSISDGEQTDSATVTVNVGVPENTPIANDDIYSTVPDAVLEVAAADGVLDNDEDVNGTGLSAVLVSGPSSGSLELDEDGSFTYTPDSGFTGEDTFIYKADDGSAESNEATVTINVTEVDYAPVAGDDSYSTGQLQTLNVPSPGLLDNDADANGEELSAELIAGPSHGDLTLNADGSFTYKPDGQHVGEDSFRYQAVAGSQSSNEATVTIEIIDQRPPNLAWVQPILDGGVLEVGDRPITLILEVSDNVGVARVEIFRWDSVDEEFVDIVTLEKAPYEFQLDPQELNPEWNQIFAIAYDEAGNRSQRQFIWLYRTVQHLVFLPFANR